MSKPARALSLSVAPRPRPTTPQVIAVVHLMNPLTIAKLDAARKMGATLAVEFDGARLVVRGSVS